MADNAFSLLPDPSASVKTGDANRSPVTSPGTSYADQVAARNRPVPPISRGNDGVTPSVVNRYDQTATQAQAAATRQAIAAVLENFPGISPTRSA
jgi:hypothetical protein